MPRKRKHLRERKPTKVSNRTAHPTQGGRKPSQAPIRQFDSFAAERGVFMRLCEAINTPRSLCCWYLAEENSHDAWMQYLTLSLPLHSDTDQFADDYLVTEMLTKNPRLPINVDRAEVALSKFREAEGLCAATNLRLIGQSTNDGAKAMVPMRFPSDTATDSIAALLSRHHDEDQVRFLLKCRRIMGEILGSLTASKLDEIHRLMRFGPGATSSVGGSKVLLSRKFASKLDATPRLIPFARPIIGPLWQAVHEVELRPLSFSKVITVPKNAKTDRTIAIEPHLNVYAQLGLGTYLKKVLTRLGLAPRDQQRNRSFAQKAYDKGYCTVDLSMASDLISVGAITVLLPEDWKLLFTTLRTDSVSITEGELTHLEKFSSMGNGFTWELESLIFYVVVAASTGLNSEDIAVFGDDLIFPAIHYGNVCKALDLLGFRVNMKKSFWQGNFFESCGRDYHRSIDVRPFFLKKDNYEDADDFAITISNAIRRYAYKRGHYFYCDRRFLRAWLYAKRRGIRADETCIPDGLGDNGIVKNFDESCPNLWRRGWEGFRGRVLQRPPITSKHSSESGGMISALHRLELSGPRHDVRVINSVVTDSTPRDNLFTENMRGRLGKPQLRDQLVIHWPDLGPWL